MNIEQIKVLINEKIESAVYGEVQGNKQYIEARTDEERHTARTMCNMGTAQRLVLQSLLDAIEGKEEKGVKDHWHSLFFAMYEEASNAYMALDGMNISGEVDGRWINGNDITSTFELRFVTHKPISLEIQSQLLAATRPRDHKFNETH